MESSKKQLFTSLIKNPKLLAYLASAKIKFPTPIQKKSIPTVLQGESSLIQGKTGSGKTFCYLLPIISNLKELEAKNTPPLPPGQPVAIIILPTRELAVQVFSLAKEISHFAKLKVRKLIGGDKGKALTGLFAAQIDLLITTPERFLRALNNNELKIQSTKILALDEADQLLESSFKKTMGEILCKFSKQKKQVILCSATRPRGYEETIQEFFHGIKFNVIGKGEENQFGHQVETFNMKVEENEKKHFLTEFVKKQAKSNGIVFVGNRFRAQMAYDTLSELGLKKYYLIHKEIEKAARARALEEFKKNGGIIVATDVMARGIDIPHLHWVLNFDLPSDAEYYLHRTGRVGRAGRQGQIFNFITSNDSDRQTNINQALLQQERNDLRLPSSQNLKHKKKNPAKLKKKKERRR